MPPKKPQTKPELKKKKTKHNQNHNKASQNPKKNKQNPNQWKKHNKTTTAPPPPPISHKNIQEKKESIFIHYKNKSPHLVSVVQKGFRGVGLGVLSKSLPTSNILWFCVIRSGRFYTSYLGIVKSHRKCMYFSCVNNQQNSNSNKNEGPVPLDCISSFRYLDEPVCSVLSRLVLAEVSHMFLPTHVTFPSNFCVVWRVLCASVTEQVLVFTHLLRSSFSF